MPLSMSMTRNSTTLIYEDDGMEVRFVLRDGDGEAAVIAKLKKLISFYDRESAAPAWKAMAQGLTRQQDAMPDVIDVTPRQFTGIPPVQPPPMAGDDYLAGNGWELIRDGDD